MIIKVAEAKVESDDKKTVKLDLSKEEALLALTTADMVRERFAEELAKPSRTTRRAIKRGDISEKRIKEQYRAAKSLVDKIGAAIIGTDADKLGIAIAKILEEKKNA